MAPSAHQGAANPAAREFTLYGVDRQDHVTYSEHFRAPSAEDAIRLAEARASRFHKVEVWERSSCLFDAIHASAAATDKGTALRRASRWLRRLSQNGAH